MGFSFAKKKLFPVVDSFLRFIEEKKDEIIKNYF
jgi:hypothetical protein